MAAAHDVRLHYFLRPDHWDVADLWVANWGPDMPDLSFRDRHDWLFEHIENLHDTGSTTICAVNAVNGAVAGFVTLNPREGALTRIVVAQTARGSGVAGALMDAAKRLAAGLLRARVPTQDAKARRFFLREGFVRAGEADGFTLMTWRG
ncbi:MAG: GNAT family N-acetyltransferase [Beijerinckiaceae bacterium]